MDVLKKQRLDSLTSLRFIAAMMIVIHHSGAYFGISQYSTMLALPQGVSFFFILSGFILSYNYSEAHGVEWKEFYLNRFARLWPAHIAATVLWLLFGYPVFDGVGTTTAFFATVANITLTHSFIPLSAFYSSLNPVAWSISVEVFFYLAFPFIVGGGLASSARWLAGSLVLLIVLMAVAVLLQLPNTTTDPMGVSASSIIYTNPLARLFEFCLGCLAAFIFKARKAQPYKSQTFIEIAASCGVILFMALIASSKFRNLFPDYYPFRGWLIWSGSCIPMAVLIYVMAIGGGKISKALSHRSMVYLGEISFSLYLVHLTALCIYMSYAKSPSSNLAGLIVYIAASISMSIVMYHAIENPCRRLIKARFRRSSPARAVKPA